MKQRALKAMRKLEDKGKNEAKEAVVINIDKESSEVVEVK